MTSTPEIVPLPTLAELASPRAADAPDDRPTTTSTRMTAVLIGLLFLTATPAFLTANALNVGVLNRPDFLTGAADDTPVLATGPLLVLGQFGVVGIAALLVPLLKRHGDALALAHVGFRVTELTASQRDLAVPLLAIELGTGLRNGTIDASASTSPSCFSRSGFSPKSFAIASDQSGHPAPRLDPRSKT